MTGSTGETAPLEFAEKSAGMLGDYLELVARNRIRLARWEQWAETEPTRASLAAYLAWAEREVLAGRSVELVVRRGGRLLGSMGARLDRGTAEIGYWIDAAAEGHGVGSAAVGELLDRLTALGVREAQAVTAAENVRSRAMLERLGFELGGDAPGPLLLARGPVARVRYRRTLTPAPGT